MSETVLQNKNVRAVILSKGAELKSLTVNGREILWCRNPDIWGKSSPVLFPAIGNVKNNLTEINGKTIKLGKHGFARDNEFTAEKTSDETAVFSYSYIPAEEDAYPFSCELIMTYTLTENGIEIRYAVKNNSSGEMYCCLGAHPAIACQNLDNCTVEFENAETASTPVMNLVTRMFNSKERIQRLDNEKTLKLNYPMFDNDVVYFDKITSRSVTFRENENCLAKISFKGFSSLGLWTPAGKRAGFLCIEPWCSSDDYDDNDGVFKNKYDIMTIPFSGTAECSMTIEA